MTAALSGAQASGVSPIRQFRTVRGGAANGATALNLPYLCFAKWVPYLEGPVEQRARQASEATRPPCSHPLIAIGSPF